MGIQVSGRYGAQTPPLHGPNPAILRRTRGPACFAPAGQMRSYRLQRFEDDNTAKGLQSSNYAGVTLLERERSSGELLRV
jgi:hypothetical protein